MRRTVITAIVLALAVTPLLAANAQAVPPSPNHVVIQTLGRRVVHRDAIRWIDGTLGTRTTVSDQFQARAVANTQVC